MTIKEFFYKIFRDAFVISFITLIVFGIFEWFEPGFVSFYISFSLLLIIPLVSGILTVLFGKIK
ncbi:hypothetical protein HZB93_00380 [Candidatus Falkowbacteria bacterium]|nr:hypothetical protein [Candidatus Falkowbacteria bacterium]